MIKVNNVTKRFEGFEALKHMSCNIPEGCIYGLVGSNGAGKSTFLRLVTGIYKPEEGEITIDEQPVWENPITKSKFVFVPDELYFIGQSSMDRMAKMYEAVYPAFDRERYQMLTQSFGLDPKKSVGTFSKGMKRQAATILALSCKPQYLFFDETFDGLDPVMRNLVKKVIYNDVCERNVTVVITSHSLRELEDTCDQLTLLHKGGVIFESDVQNLKTSLFKVQVAFECDFDKETFQGIEMLEFVKKGKVANFIVRGEKGATVAKLQEMHPVLLEVLPLSLEEVFVYEMEALGYAFKDVLL